MAEERRPNLPHRERLKSCLVYSPHYSNLLLPTDFIVLKTVIHLYRIFKCLALKNESFEEAVQTKCGCVSIF
jgi:hypothetical protein